MSETLSSTAWHLYVQRLTSRVDPNPIRFKARELKRDQVV